MLDKVAFLVRGHRARLNYPIRQYGDLAAQLRGDHRLQQLVDDASRALDGKAQRQDPAGRGAGGEDASHGAGLGSDGGSGSAGSLHGQGLSGRKRRASSPADSRSSDFGQPSTRPTSCTTTGGPSLAGGSGRGSGPSPHASPARDLQQQRTCGGEMPEEHLGLAAFARTAPSMPARRPPGGSAGGLGSGPGPSSTARHASPHGARPLAPLARTPTPSCWAGASPSCSAACRQAPPWISQCPARTPR